MCNPGTRLETSLKCRAKADRKLASSAVVEAFITDRRQDLLRATGRHCPSHASIPPSTTTGSANPAPARLHAASEASALSRDIMYNGARLSNLRCASIE